ncbi:MAG: Cysteine-tRNA ligase [Parcubacteria group bacterium GW2011_GWF2_38_76]|nr:MAG: Cysteine-tRNA ligase [Parcubacteria group bacterium GW2011_GWF2_38_76]
MIKLHNSLSRKKEIFKPITEGIVKMYACGPTVYDYAHIGNFRTYIMEDVLRRILKYNDLSVLYVQNITDVGHLVGDGDTGEDKMEKGAKAAGKTAWEIAKFFTEEYLKDSHKLNILDPNVSARATDHIADQIAMVKKLEELGFAYKISDGIYFDTSKSKNYGEIAQLDKEGLREGARVEKNPEKRNETDFALWKFSPKDKKRQMEWNSPWGVGFPGWHIECSAMSTKYLGETFDVHAGGVDLLPVHHTNEIAQNEAVFGHKTINYWVHGAFLLVNGGRMGKSLGNAYTLVDLEKRGFDPLVFRYFVFSASYRQPLNFTWQAMEGASRSYENIIQKISDILEEPLTVDKNYLAIEYVNKFKELINNDMALPEALSILWEIIKDKAVPNKIKINTIANFDEVLGLSLIEKAVTKKGEGFNIPEEVIALSKERELARSNKDWKKSDEIRKKIIDMGFEIKDTDAGTKVSLIK